MNKQALDILRLLKYEGYINQRAIAEATGLSLGAVNNALKELRAEQYIDGFDQLTKKSCDLFKRGAPKNAIILAAGAGMRMVPINHTAPKALLEVNGETLIERIIGQLHAAEIRDITVVVGFMKESFEYLIDQQGVNLVVNNEYSKKNNLHSLAIVADRLHNTYIIPGDIWCRENPFSETELYSWYMVTDEQNPESPVRVNRKKELVSSREGEFGNVMIGISYFLGSDAEKLRNRLRSMDHDGHMDAFWEAALYEKERMVISAREVCSSYVTEINTYEQLRELDSDSNHLKSDAMQVIAKALNCTENEIVDIRVLKKGMTNRSFFFSVDGEKYIMRIPGEGTDKLINRKHEYNVLKTISGYGFCDDPVFMDPENGYKITRYLENVRTCDSEREEDLKKCMDLLKRMHKQCIRVAHSFDIFNQIDYYESLWGEDQSVYRDYYTTKDNVFSLIHFIDRTEKEWCLSHIDAVPDNFLFYNTKEGETTLQLTDWEYAGMQDPHVDIAMFCIYSLYNKQKCDHLIDIYFENMCDDTTRAKIYCYIAACGLLWSNWCEYKRRLGMEFGEYSLRQYRYAKDFFRYAKELISSLDS